jgi:spore coat polysaccharide biosynthesis protein SpsF (cytidylyltransferase family)
MSRVLAFVQARMTSSRLPGKVLEPIGGRPSIVFMVERLRRSKSLDSIVVVTSDDPSDDPLVEVLAKADIPAFRGDLQDVLARFCGALSAHPADVVVRLTGDCPLLDPAVVDAVVAVRRDTDADYASNVDPPTFPDGMDVEVFTAQALVQAHAAARLPSEREHVTPWMRASSSGLRRTNLQAIADLSALRLTVDYPDDLELVRCLTDTLRHLGDSFDLFDILRAMQADPRLLKMNHHPRNEGLAASVKADAAAR